MAFCRFSSDNHRCDLYVYAHVDGGYAIHVAAHRVHDDTPCVQMPRDSSDEEFKRWLAEQDRQSDFLGTYGRPIPINGKYDGASFYSQTPSGLIYILNILRDAGYNFPNHVYEAAHEDMEDLDDDE